MRHLMKSMCHNRPLPSPLPQERANHSPSPTNSCGWIGRLAIHGPESVRRLFPLPGGEGQGEGGRFQ